MVKPKEGKHDAAIAVTEDRAFATTEAEEIRRLLKRAAQDIVTVGQKLAAVKAKLKHGEWGEWLEREFDMGERTAQNFMSVGERFKSENIADLNVTSSALYLLAAPSTPEVVRQELIEAARSGERITHTAVKAAVEKETEPALGEAGPLSYLSSIPEPYRLYVARLEYLEGECSLADIQQLIFASPEFQELKARFQRYSLNNACVVYWARYARKMGAWLNGLEERGAWKGKSMSGRQFLDLANKYPCVPPLDGDDYQDVLLCRLKVAAMDA